MLTTELPPELWQRIALHLPWKTLENVKFVNKLFYEVATNRFLSCLDLAIPPPQAEIELFHKLDSSAEVRRRLKLASEKPHLIKALRLPLRISSDGIYHSHQLHLPFLYPPAFASAETLLRPFLSLAPSFAELHRIHIIDYENSGPIEHSLFETVWSLFHLRLTHIHLEVLSGNVQDIWLPRGNEHITFPALRVFRLSSGSTKYLRQYNTVYRTILRHAPLLEELQFSVSPLPGDLPPPNPPAFLPTPGLAGLPAPAPVGFPALGLGNFPPAPPGGFSTPVLLALHGVAPLPALGLGVAPPGFPLGVPPVGPPTLLSMEKHPRFRALSWVSRSTKSADDIIRDSNLRSFLTSIWRECSSQLEAIHLDTALDYSPLLDQQDFGQVTKLRIRGSTLSVDVCQRLLKALRLAGCIITLELPALPNDRLWRRMRVLDSVRHLWFAPYMGKRVSLLEVLQLVASKTPNLQQLVIEIDLSNRAEMTYLSEVRDGTINTFMTTQTLQRWSLEDFGVTWKNGDDVVLMKAILRAVKILVPSLYSFYGTGTLDTPLEEDFTGNWFGLWKGAI